MHLVLFQETNIAQLASLQIYYLGELEYQDLLNLLCLIMTHLTVNASFKKYTAINKCYYLKLTF